MAVGGDYGTDNQYIVYKITVVQNWQSIEGNYSNINVYVDFRRTNTGYTTYGSGTVYCRINGSLYSASVTPNDKITNGGIRLFSTAENIYHNNDGTKSLQCSAWISHNRVTSSEQGFWVDLTTIPRASSISGGSGTIEAGSTINISSHSSSFTHTIEYYFGNTNGTIATKTSSTSIAWTLPASLYAQIPNSTSGTGTIYCHTYSSGGSYVGRSQCDFTASVASSKIPTLSSLTASQTTGLIMGKTKTTLSINGAASVCNASISSYRIWCDNPSVSSSSKSFVYSTNTPGSLVFKATVTDSRGRTSAVKSITLNVAPYNVPTLSGVYAKRCNSNGALNDRGTYINVYASATFADCTTTKAINIYSKKSSDSTWSAATAYTNKTNKIIGTFDINTTYNVKIVATDNYNASATQIINVSSQYIPLDICDHGIAIGKASEKNAFEVNMNTEITGSLTVNGNGISQTSAANTIAQRDSAGDLNARLMRSSYMNQPDISGGIAFRKNTTDNYIRFCNNPEAIRNWLGATSVETIGADTNRALKFSDGTLICYGYKWVTGTTPHNYYGWYYETFDGDIVTFPVPFAPELADPSLAFSVSCQGGSVMGNAYNWTKTKIDTLILWSPTPEVSYRAYYSWIAIGRWKA